MVNGHCMAIFPDSSASACFIQEGQKEESQRYIWGSLFETDYMDLDGTKPVSGVSNKARLKPVSSATEKFCL